VLSQHRSKHARDNVSNLGLASLRFREADLCPIRCVKRRLCAAELQCQYYFPPAVAFNTIVNGVAAISIPDCPTQ
jgi:hypothetical protein